MEQVIGDASIQGNSGTRSAYRGVSSGSKHGPTGWNDPTLSGPIGPAKPTTSEVQMRWTKPEAEVVAVTMEVTAYVATL